jgi:hypothetical protein
MGPNDAELVRVFTREVGGVIADVTFPFGIPFHAVIECEAGEAVHAAGASYEIKIDVLDFSAMASVITSAIAAGGSLGDQAWPNQAHQFVFTVPAAAPENEGHIWKILASLKVGRVNPDVSLAESPFLVITSP